MRLRHTERTDRLMDRLPAPWWDGRQTRVDALRQLLNTPQEPRGWRTRDDRTLPRVLGRLVTLLAVWAILCGPVQADTWYPSSLQDGQAAWAGDGLGLIAWGGLWRLTPDGLGIDGGQADYNPWEIGQTPLGEWASVWFATPQTEVTVELAQFYPWEDDCFHRVHPDCVPNRTWTETGTYWVDGGEPIGFAATHADGRYSLIIARNTPFTQLGLTGDGLWSATDGAEFTLASIAYTVTAVPEPEVWILLGVGLFSLISSAIRNWRKGRE